MKQKHAAHSKKILHILNFSMYVREWEWLTNVSIWKDYRSLDSTYASLPSNLDLPMSQMFV